MKAAVATTGTGMGGKAAKMIDDGAPLLERIRFISKHILRWRGSWRTRRV